MSVNISRRRLLEKGAVAISSPYIVPTKKTGPYRLKMASLLYGVEPFKQATDDLSARLKLQSDSELLLSISQFDHSMVNFEQFSKSSVDLLWANSSIFDRTYPELSLFFSVPFGMNLTRYNKWIYSRSGQSYHREAYEKVGLRAFPFGLFESKGLWSNVEILRTTDLFGQQARINSSFGLLLEKFGVQNHYSISPNQIKNYLRSKQLNLVSCAGPHHSLELGLSSYAPYFLASDDFQPYLSFEIYGKLDTLRKLPNRLQDLLEVEIAKTNQQLVQKLNALNGNAMKRIQNDPSIKILIPSESLLIDMKKRQHSLLNRMAAKSIFNEKLFSSYFKFC